MVAGCSDGRRNICEGRFVRSHASSVRFGGDDCEREMTMEEMSLGRKIGLTVIFVIDAVAVVVLLSILGLIGCTSSDMPSASFDKIDNQDAIAMSVWTAYGRTDEPPRVGWVTEPSCVNGRWYGFRSPANPATCAGGFYEEGDDVVYVMRLPGQTWAVPFAHEFAHVIQFRDGIEVGHGAPWFRNTWSGPRIDAAAVLALAAGAQ